MSNNIKIILIILFRNLALTPTTFIKLRENIFLDTKRVNDDDEYKLNI